MTVVALGVSHSENWNQVFDNDKDDSIREAMEQHPADTPFRVANPVEKRIHAKRPDCLTNFTDEVGAQARLLAFISVGSSENIDGNFGAGVEPASGEEDRG